MRKFINICSIGILGIRAAWEAFFWDWGIGFVGALQNSMFQGGALVRCIHVI